MIVPDTNLLIFAYNDQRPEHDAALRWWEGLVNGSESVGVPWIVAIGFARLISHPSVLRPPLSGSEASDCVNDWFSHPHITPINPGINHLAYFRELLAASGGGGNLVPDAHIAALAMEYDAEVHTHNNSDFARFPGLRWRNPLQ